MDKTGTINILCATDNKYAPFCGIMLTSLFENNKDYRFNVYVFASVDISNSNEKKYIQLGKLYGNAVCVMRIDDSKVEAFPISEGTYITKPTYYRLFAADLLPKDIHKVIYLDCDIIVVGDIMPLWSQSIEGKALAGVRDYSDYFVPLCKRLDSSSLYEYFNAGVMVCNLDYWRQNQLFERTRDFIKNNTGKLLYMDQDALNGVLQGECEMIQAKFNFQTALFRRDNWDYYSTETQRYYFDEVKDMIVIHYSSTEKPWDIRSYGGPFYSVWHGFRKKSLWKCCVDINPIMKTAKHLVKRHVFPKMLRNQRRDWVVSTENEEYFR